MKDKTNKKEFNTVWRFHCDAQKGEYTLTIEYDSDLPPARHEKMHRKLKNMATDWLIKKGVEFAKVKIDISRTEMDAIPQTITKPIPHVIKKENLISN